MRYSATTAAATMTIRDAMKIAISPASSRKSAARARPAARHRSRSGTDAAAAIVGLDIWGSLRGAAPVPGCTEGHGVPWDRQRVDGLVPVGVRSSAMESVPTVAHTPVLSRVARIPSYIRAMVGMLRPSFITFFGVWMRHARQTRGWLRIPDGYLLYRLARDATSSGDVVEIGSAWGRSTICLAAGSRSVDGGPVVAIDPHTGDTWFLEESGLDRIDSFTEFSSNIARAGLSDWVAPMVMTSEAAAAEFPDRPIRLLFIDGLHTLEGVEQDIDDWVPRVAAGGVIVFDDYDNVADGVGVREAVDRLLASGYGRSAPASGVQPRVDVSPARTR